MFDWTNIDNTYIYDGTFEGFLSVIFYMFENKKVPQNIASNSEYIPSIINYSIFMIETDYSKSSRVFDGLLSLSDLVFYYTRNVFLSDEKNKELLLAKYIINAFHYGSNINNMLTIDEVLKVQKISKRVTFEIMRFKGFVRFIEVNNNLFYAKINPDNNILEFICNHFKKRLPMQNFMIQDVNRNLIGAYNHEFEKIEIIDLTTIPDFNIPKISDAEKEYQDMWKMFFKNIALKERTNPRLQKQYMPKRYWKYIFETN